jgi:hypothetical protein
LIQKNYFSLNFLFFAVIFYHGRGKPSRQEGKKCYTNDKYKNHINPFYGVCGRDFAIAYSGDGGHYEIEAEYVVSKAVIIVSELRGPGLLVFEEGQDKKQACTQMKQHEKLEEKYYSPFVLGYVDFVRKIVA